MKLLLGLFLIFLASPFILWTTEGTRNSKDFRSAEQVSSTTVQDGYIAISGTVDQVTNLTCPEGTGHEQCLYLSTHTETFTYSEEVQCGELDSDVEIIEYREDRCEDGECEPCYLVENSDWETVGDRSDYADFGIGSYDIRPSGSANVVGETVFEVDYDNTDPFYGDQRTRYRYLENEGTILVAGQASNGAIRGGGQDTLFLSNLNFDATAEQLKVEDRATKWAGRIFSLILMMLGFVLVVAQFVDPLTGVMRVVPILGRKAQDATRSVIYAAAALLGAVVWLPVFLIVFLSRNIWIAIIVLVIIAGVAIYMITTGKKVNIKLPIKKK